ncbi:MAG: glycosyltransferase family 1 protein, partial [Candidatus Woesebacteria bacterium]|nr:glycosyltransferase family 1 protein [Candidatus Woesebacteria bacterium]
PAGKNPGRLPKVFMGQKYILNQGGIDIRKNLDNLIKAFALVNIKHPDIKLVITGRNLRMKKGLDILVKKMNLQKQVVFVGYVDDGTFAALVKSAVMICYPTLSEGFGFSILEGFGAGVPVISSNTSSIPEIASDAAILVNPESITEIKSATEKVLSDPKLVQKMVLKGREQYNKFSWEKTVNEYLDLYNHI